MYTAQCNGVLSQGVQTGGLRVFADHTRKKQMENKCTHNLCAPCDVLRIFNFTLRLQYMQVAYAPDEPLLFWLREKLEDPKFEPTCWDKNGAGSGISLVYLWIQDISIVSIGVIPHCMLHEQTGDNKNLLISYTAKLLFHQSPTRHSDYTVTTTVTM